MIKGKIIFIRYFDYESEGETEEECFEKARKAFVRDMRRSVAGTWYDDFEERYEYENDDEEDIDDASVAMRESLGDNWW
jgi:hypothetical protein